MHRLRTAGNSVRLREGAPQTKGNAVDYVPLIICFALAIGLFRLLYGCWFWDCSKKG